MGASSQRASSEAPRGTSRDGRHSGDVSSPRTPQQAPSDAGANRPSLGSEKWRNWFLSHAACKGLALTGELDFFAEDTYAERAAKAVCKTCAVKDECLELALHNHEKYGVWGGTTWSDRRKIARQRRRARSTG